jgi:FecR-like protein
VEPQGGQARIARVGETVYEADTLTTFAAAEVHIAMADGAQLSLRENTKVTISIYVANGDDGDRSVLDLAKGTLRSITGWIGKYRRAAYQIRTPVVTIGVRGTDHEPTHLPPGDPRGEPGSYDKVNEGSTVMQSQFGSVEVPASRAAHFAPERRAAPRVLASVPAFFKPARNEQRFVERARESVRTLDAQRENRRQVVQRNVSPQKPAAPVRSLQKAPPAQKKAERLENRRQELKKKAAERNAGRKASPQRRERIEKKNPERRRLEKK